MKSKYEYAVKTGIIYGILFSVIYLIVAFLHISDSLPRSLSTLSDLFINLIALCVFGISGMLILLYMGYQVVRHSIGFIRNRKDAIILSALAGVIATIIDDVVRLTVETIIPGIINYSSGGFSSYDAPTIVSILVDTAEGIILFAIIAALGGLYYLSKKSKKP